MKQHNDNEGMQNLKTIDFLEEENWNLKKEIDRLNILHTFVIVMLLHPLPFL